MSFGLVLVATVLLVLGFVQGGLGFIYGSIAFSVAAAAVLFVAVRMTKPKTAPAAAPTPLVPDPEPAVEKEPVLVGAGAPTRQQPVARPSRPAAVEPEPQEEEWIAADEDDAWDEPEEGWAEDEDEIADYDGHTEGEGGAEQELE